jgi:DNA-binding CsgD family transcriptional regulator
MRSHDPNRRTNGRVRVHSSARLTPFERQLLELVADGLRRREIAEELNRAPQTISNSLTIAKDKLGARTLAEAASLVSHPQSDHRVKRA